MKKLLGMMLMVLSLSGQAGDKGNGGDIILCNDKRDTNHLKLLDIYEAEKRGLRKVFLTSATLLLFRSCETKGAWHLKP